MISFSASGVTPVSKASEYSGFSASVGMSVTRLALPHRSPRPFSVPCTWRAPARIAASELATALPVSLWAWMASFSPGMTRATSATIRSISCGSAPPLVSHITAQRAPASIAVLAQASAYSGLAL